MKKVLIASVLLLTGLGIGQSVPRPRFEVIVQEKMGGDSYNFVRVIHDRESGQEITCFYASVYAGNSVSCVPTGRNWK